MRRVVPRSFADERCYAKSGADAASVARVAAMLSARAGGAMMMFRDADDEMMSARDTLMMSSASRARSASDRALLSAMRLALFADKRDMPRDAR